FGSRMPGASRGLAEKLSYWDRQGCLSYYGLLLFLFGEELLVLGKACLIELVLGDELEGGAVDAVAQAGLVPRAVVEGVAEVTAAAGGLHFDAAHAVRVVLVLAHGCLLEGLPKARPAGAGIEFVHAGEEGFAADDVHVDAGLVVVPVGILEGRF